MWHPLLLTMDGTWVVCWQKGLLLCLLPLAGMQWARPGDPEKETWERRKRATHWDT